jgi:hypothetical protein
MSILPVLLTLLVLLRSRQRRRRQIRFIRETLAKDRAPIDAPRVIVSLSTLPDRIANLEPTLDCLINQTRAPDEIVLALPEFSLRQQEPYVIPEYLASYSRVRILRSDKDWGPATKFIPVVQEELAAGRGDTLIMVVDDDRRLSPRCARDLSSLSSTVARRGALFSRRADAERLDMAPGKNHLRGPDSRTKKGRGDHRLRKLFYPAAFLRCATLGLFRRASGRVLYGRHLD